LGTVRRGIAAEPSYTLDERFCGDVEGLCEECQVGQRAAFFLPLPLREGNTAKTCCHFLRDCCCSGGRTETRLALHAFRRLNLPAAAAGNETLCRNGSTLAVRSGRDPFFEQAAPIGRHSTTTTRASLVPLFGHRPSQTGLNRRTLVRHQIGTDNRERTSALGPTKSSARPAVGGSVNVTVP